MINFLLLFIFCAFTRSAIIKENVQVGNHFIDNRTSNVYSKQTLFQTTVKLDKNVVSYIFTDPSESDGNTHCFMNLNKLFGRSRCNLFHHEDSDRFVFRRNQKCLSFDGDRKFLGVNMENQCTNEELNQVQVAAYAYDGGSVPYHSENQGTLLKYFNTKLSVEVWYGLQLIVQPTKTIYKIHNSTNLLETITIDHRDCGEDQTLGYRLSLYFGGSCDNPGPNNYTVYYDDTYTFHEEKSTPENQGEDPQGNQISDFLVPAVIIGVVGLIIVLFIIAIVVSIIITIICVLKGKKKDRNSFELSTQQ